MRVLVSLKDFSMTDSQVRTGLPDYCCCCGGVQGVQGSFHCGSTPGSSPPCRRCGAAAGRRRCRCPAWTAGSASRPGTRRRPGRWAGRSRTCSAGDRGGQRSHPLRPARLASEGDGAVTRRPMGRPAHTPNYFLTSASMGP